MTAIEQLAELVGFHGSYVNNFGTQVFANDESRIALLNAMGFSIGTEKQIKNCIDQLTNEQWMRMLPTTKVFNAEDKIFSIDISVSLSEMEQIIDWQIITESAEPLSGQVTLDELQLISEKNINGVDYSKYILPLGKIPEGYHQLEVTVAGSESSEQSCNLIVAPKTCYRPEDAADYKMWGLAAQLYSLKSDNNWGIGDFTDLQNLVVGAAEKGAATIGLNPLHPLFPGNTAHRSPYSPSSRNFLNGLYISVEKVANFKDCQAAQQHYRSEEFQENLKRAKQAEQIDYPLVASLKSQILELLYEHFIDEHIKKSSAASVDFNDFRDEFGKDLKVLATFDALYEYFREIDFNAYGWTSWPEEYQHPDSAAVKLFQENNQHRIRYFEFIQWIADRQLATVAEVAKEKGMPVGLYLDLAVGCDGGGADVWANRSVYVSGGSVGAPPDALNQLGQDWGLTPINPIELKNQGYLPLVKAIRSNMRHAGALRIDHVLGYMRQYWVAPGKKADHGIYISFPFEEMLRIIALESKRSKCIVIGEDLGTTPDGFGSIMASAGLLSYKLLPFERWESGLYKSSDNYQQQSLVTVSTHDLPTLDGWWTGNDLKWREKLGLYPNKEMQEADKINRIKDREYLISALLDMKVLDEDSIPSTNPAVMNEALSIAVQRFLSRAPSKIQMTPLEDALGLIEQVNIPGTIDEHPNWLQKLPFTVDTIWQQQTMKNLIQVMNEERKH